MAKNIKITLLQMDIAWGEVEANLCAAQKAMEASEGSDLYVLPEMFSTGFVTSPEGMAEESGQSLEWMKAMAKKLNAAVAGSVATKVGEGDYRNRFYFVKPQGEVDFYDKHHLFTYGGEHKSYRAGQERKVVQFRGVRFLVLVCYDLRFPLWSRNREDYDCILYVASWPSSRLEAWRTLLRARAIENQCYVAGVNRVGTDPNCHYCGGTAMIDSYGKTMFECVPKMVEAHSAIIDMEELESFRQKFPVLKDRD